MSENTTYNSRHTYLAYAFSRSAAQNSFSWSLFLQNNNLPPLVGNLSSTTTSFQSPNLQKWKRNIAEMFQQASILILPNLTQNKSFTGQLRSIIYLHTGQKNFGQKERLGRTTPASLSTRRQPRETSNCLFGKHNTTCMYFCSQVYISLSKLLSVGSRQIYIVCGCSLVHRTMFVGAVS